MINTSVLNAAELLKGLKTNPGLRLRDFCEERKISLHYMEQIGRKLRIAGLILSKRGPGGGYVLAKQEIQLTDLLRIFMGAKLKTENELDAQIVKSLSKIKVL